MLWGVREGGVVSPRAEGAPRLHQVVEDVVARALETRSGADLRAAWRVLRVLERMAINGGQPVPERVVSLLEQVRLLVPEKGTGARRTL